MQNVDSTTNIGQLLCGPKAALSLTLINLKVTENVIIVRSNYDKNACADLLNWTQITERVRKDWDLVDSFRYTQRTCVHFEGFNKLKSQN